MSARPTERTAQAVAAIAQSALLRVTRIWQTLEIHTGMIAFRIAAAITAAVMIVGAIVFTAQFWMSSAALSSRLVELLSAEAASLQSLARSGDIDGLRRTIAERAAAEPSRLYLLAGPGATRVAGNLPRWPAEIAPGSPGGTFRYRRGNQSDEHFAAGVAVDAGAGARLLVARDLADQQDLARRTGWLLLAGFGLLSLTGLAVGLVTSRLLLRRLDAISAAAGRIVAGEFSDRVPVGPSGDEIDRLAGHLNAMLDRIEQLMSGLREVSDNIAHDLRTPLTRLRHRAELALRDPGGAEVHRHGLEQVIEEADALIATFNALLQIARLEAGAVESAVEPFDLADLVADVADLYQPVAEEAGLALAVTTEPGIVVSANRPLVGQALANLVDNAVKYGRPESAATPATVDVRTERCGGRVHVVVCDHGPGIPAAQRDRVLRRFVRLQPSRTAPGTGLGLSLVAALSRLIGGRLVLEDNAPGLRVTLELPERSVTWTN